MALNLKTQEINDIREKLLVPPTQTSFSFAFFKWTSGFQPSRFKKMQQQMVRSNLKC